MTTKREEWVCDVCRASHHDNRGAASLCEAKHVKLEDITISGIEFEAKEEIPCTITVKTMDGFSYRYHRYVP